jgi:glycosyltransferase involved in cell wall biosynthesis
MKISVVIPAYNEESFLPRLLTSLRHQTFSLPYEIIVVDNNSTDKTAQIAKSFGAHVVKEKKRGYAFACNAGFAAAKGEIIARADADFVQPKDWLENIWKAFEKDKQLIALGGPTYPLETNWLQNILFYPGIVIWQYLLKLLGRGFLFPNMAVRQSAYKKCGGFDTGLEFGEDTQMCLSLKKVGKVKLFTHIYNYTSIRRMKSLGLYNLIVGYSFGNQIAMWKGKKATVGLEVIREIPKERPRTYNPWVFLFGLPASLALILLIFTSYMLPTPEGQRVVANTTRVAKLSDKAIKKQIQEIKQTFSWNRFFYTSPIKEI